MKNVQSLAQKILSKNAKVPAPSTTSTELSTTPVAPPAPPPPATPPAASEIAPPAPATDPKAEAAACPPGWPRRLARLGVFPATPEEMKVPGWLARQHAKIHEALAAERARVLAEVGPKRLPPVAKEDLLSETVIDGKTLAEWDELDKQQRGLDGLPGWADWALRNWRERGKPTRQKQAKESYDSLMEKANDALNLALFKEKQAQDESLPEKKRLSFKQQAEKQRERHAKLVAEADAIAAEMKKAVS